MNKFRRTLAKAIIQIKSPSSLDYAHMALDLFQAGAFQVQAYQREALKKLLFHATTKVPYYKQLLPNIASEDMAINAFPQIPVLTKDIIRKRYADLLSTDCEERGCYENTSGGSTGEPVLFMQDKEYFAKNFGDKILFGMLNDKYPGDHELKLWGSERDILQGSIGLKEHMINTVYNRSFVNSFVLDEEHLAQSVEQLNKKKPVQLWTYADSGYELGRYILRRGLHPHNPANIVTTAGVLYPEMRETISSAFPQSRILNQYGSREAGVIGIEISGGDGIRVFDHSVLLEVLTDSGKICREGQGSLLITNLTNYSMPLIRFDIGDQGEIAPCSTNYSGGFSVLRKLQGRKNAHFKKADGSVVHGEYITHIFYGKDWIRNFKVTQKGYNYIEMLIELQEAAEKNQRDLDQMLQDIEAVMGSCQIDVHFVDHIPKLASGKYQFVVSEL